MCPNLCSAASCTQRPRLIFFSRAFIEGLFRADRIHMFLGIGFRIREQLATMASRLPMAQRVDRPVRAIADWHDRQIASRTAKSLISIPSLANETSQPNAARRGQPKLFSKINAFSKFIRANCTYSRAVSIRDSQRKKCVGRADGGRRDKLRHRRVGRRTGWFCSAEQRRTQGRYSKL